MERCEDRLLLSLPSGHVLQLDGQNDVARVTSTSALNLAAPDNTFTIEGWFFVRSLGDNQNRRLISKSQEYGVGVIFNETSMDSLYFSVNNFFSPAQVVTVSGSTHLTIGWHHFAATVAESAGPGAYEQSIYLDGVRLSRRLNAPAVNLTANSLNVGAFDGAGSGPYSGYLDEVRLSDSVRYSGTSYEVPQNPFDNDPSTRALWHFDEAIGSMTFADASSNGLMLTGLNGAQTAIPPVPSNNPPIITSDGGGANATRNVDENSAAVTTVTATDPDSGTGLTYSITGGADAAKFTIEMSSGILTFVSPPNFEAPADVGTNNIYNVTVQVSDGVLVDAQAIAVTVINFNEAPVITSDGGGDTASVNVAENTTSVTTVTAIDPDADTMLTYSISGGADFDKFTIGSSSGVLTFVSAPDFEAPTDAGADNDYNVSVQVSDGTLTDTQAIEVMLMDINESPQLRGDYNVDGAVDAADYVVWRKTLGQTGIPAFSGADGDGDGDVTQADYIVWRANFGRTLPPLEARNSVAVVTLATASASVIGPAGNVPEQVDDSTALQLALADWATSYADHKAAGGNEWLEARRAVDQSPEYGPRLLAARQPHTKAGWNGAMPDQIDDDFHARSRGANWRELDDFFAELEVNKEVGALI
jgi:hypothetical protein